MALRIEEQDSPIDKLRKFIPSEASALYLLLFDALASESATVGDIGDYIGVIVGAILSLGLLIIYRFRQGASAQIKVVSVVAFLIWIYVIGNGPWQAFGIDFRPGVGTAAVAVFIAYAALLAKPDP